MGAFTRWLHGGSRAEPTVVSARIEPENFGVEFATIFANASIGIAVTDGKGTFVHVNAAMERFLGFEPGGLSTVQIKQITHPDDFEADVAAYRTIRNGERDSYQLEKRYIRKDGAVVWGRLVTSVVRDADGNIQCALGMVEDITEQRRIREQLDASMKEAGEAHRRLKLYLERAPLACIVWDEQRIVREWNPAAVAMFGYTSNEAIGRNVYELTGTPEGLAIVEQMRPQVLAGRDYPEGVVVENRRKDGTRLHCRWHFTVLQEGPGAMNGVIAFGIDVTASVRAEEERRALEANLRQAQKMQSLGTLAGGIAHDFNNILLAISGNTQLAREDLAGEHPAQEALAEVSRASARASSIVNQILMFSRREESQQVAVDLRSILEESHNLLRATLSARVAIRMHIVGTAPMVLGDPAQIHQVLLNLATNGAHAMSETGGTLDLALEPVDVDDELARHTPDLRVGHYHRIAVRDTGVGMAPQVIERIFEPFFTTKPRGQGTGLGLSVVHGIVKGHGGAISLTSAPGQGTTFFVYLPALAHAPKVAAELPQAVVTGQGQHILYVDDEEPLVFLITRVLERLGYRVSGFIDANVALSAFQADPHSFDAVVTDLSMPGMSGAEFARHVLATRADVPVVMTSGYVRVEDREQAKQAGIRELLLKPNTVEALGEVLHRLLKREAERA